MWRYRSVGSRLTFWEKIVDDLHGPTRFPRVRCMLDFEANSGSRRSANGGGRRSLVGGIGWCLAVSHRKPRTGGSCSKRAQNLAEERPFRFGRRLALVAMAADELVIWGGIAILAR